MPWELPITIEDTTYPVRFNTDSEPSQTDIDEAVAYIMQQRSAPTQKPGPPDSGQGRLSSFASSVGRGAASIVPGVIGGAGYLTGSEGMVEAADTIEAGINRALPVNPAYEDEFLMKAGQALGQVVPMVATGGTAGAVGKSMALARGVAMPAAKAAGTQLAGRVMLGSGMLQGTRGGGQAAEQYGMEGGAAYARALLGGAIEGATEKYMFGLGTELAPVKKLIGDALDKGAAGIAKAATTEGAEEAVAEIGGNLGTTLLAPSGVETPGMLAGAGEAAALGAIAGGALGGFNAALGGDATPTVEGTAVVQPPAPIQEEERLEAESAIESAIAKMQAPTAVSPVGTLTQEPGETGEAFLGRVDAQRESLAKGLEAAVAQTVETNADVLPATAAALKTEVAAPAVDPVQAARARLRGTASAAEQADMRAQLQRAEDEGILADVFAEERQRAVAREDARRRLAELDAERARLEQEIAAQEPPTPPSEQPQPEPPVVEEAVPPVEPIPAVEEDAAAQAPPVRKSKAKTPSLSPSEQLRAEGKVGFPMPESAGGGWFSTSDWRKSFGEIPNLWNKVDLLRAVANNRGTKATEQDLADALALGQTLLSEDAPDLTNLGYDISQNPAASPQTKAAALAFQEAAFEKLSEPPITEGNFPETENVVAPAGEAGVGLGMEEKLLKPYASIAVPDLEQLPDIDWDRRRAYLEGKLRNNRIEEQELLKTPKNQWETYHYNTKARINEVSASLRAAIQDMQLARPDLEKGFAKSQSGSEAAGVQRTTSEVRAATTDERGAGDELQQQPATLQRDGEQLKSAETSGQSQTGKSPSIGSTGGNVVADARISVESLKQQARDIVKAQFGEGETGLKDALSVFDGRVSAKNFIADDIPALTDSVLEEWRVPKAQRDAIYKQLTKQVEAYYAQEEAPPPQTQPVAEKTTGGTQGKAEVPKAKLTSEEQAALRLSKRKGAENRGDGIFFIPEKLVTPEVRKAVKRGGSNVEFKAWADVTGNPSDRGYAVLDRQARKAERQVQQPPTAPAPEAQQPAPQRDTSKPELLKKTAPATDRKIAAAKKALAVTGGRGTIERLTGDSFAQTRVDLLSELTGMKVPKAKAGINALMKAFYQEFGVPLDTEAGMQKRLAKALQEAETPKTETPKTETPKAETPKAETPKAETPKAETPKARLLAEIDGWIAMGTNNGTRELDKRWESSWAMKKLRESNKLAYIKNIASGTEVGKKIALGKAKTLAEFRSIVESIEEGGQAPIRSQEAPNPAIVSPEEYQRQRFFPGNQPKYLANALADKLPVSKAAVDAYGITLPEGYVAEGELYVYRPEGGKVEEAPAPAPAPENLEEKKRTRLGKLLGDANRKEGSPSRIEMLDEARSLWRTEKEYRYKGLIRLRDDITTLIQSSLGTDTPNSKKIAEALIEGRPNLVDKIASLAPVKQAEMTNAGAYPSTLTGFGYERGDRGVYTHPKAPPAPTKPKVTTKSATEEKAAELKKSIKRKIGGQTNMLLDPTLFADAVILGTYYVEKGARTFAQFTKAMIADIGESIRENLEDIYNAIKAQPGFDTTGMDEVGTTAAEPPPAAQPAPEPQAAAVPPPPVQPPPPPAAAATAPAPLEGPVNITNAQLNQVAEILGLPQLETPQDGPYSWKSAWADAQAEIASNPNRGSELVSEMLIRPREPSPVEVPILLHEAVVRTNAYNAAVEAQTKATAGEQEAANQRVADAINALADVQQASAVMGTISARALNFRKMSAWMDFSLANMVLRLKGAKQADLSKEEMKDAQDTDKLIKAKQKEIAEKEASAGAQAELTSIFDETLKEAVSLAKKNANDLIIQSRAAAKQGKSMKDFLVEKREEAKKRIRQRGNNLNVGLNPADLLDHAIIMASYIAEGVVSLADLTAKMVGDYGPAIEKHIPQIKKEADAIVAAEQQVFEAPEEGTAKSYADQLRDSQGESLSDRWVYNRVKEWLVEQGPDALKRPSKDLLNEAFAVVTKEVNEFDSTITEQQLRDMFSGYGKVKFPNPDEAAKKLRQMRRLELLFDKLVRARAGVPPLRAGLQRDETTPEEREALRLLNDAMKELDIPHAPSSGNIKTSLDAVKTRLKNSIDDLNKQIKERKRAERPRKEVEYDEEAKALEAQRDKLQELLDQIDPPRPPTVQERIEARLKDLDKQIANLKAKVAAKGYAPAQNKTPITDEIQAKIDERDTLNETLKNMRIEAEGLPVLTQEQVNEMAQRNLTRQIDALEEKIRKRDFLPKEGLKPEASPMLFRLQSKVEALRKQRDQIKEDLGIRKKQKTDAELIDAAVVGLEKTIDKLNKQINENDLTSKARPSKVPEVAKIKNLKAERDSLREEVQRLRKAKEDAAKDPVAEKIKADRKQLQRMIQSYEEKIKKGDFRKRPKIAKEYDDSLMQLEIDLDNIKAEWSKKVFEAHLASRPRLTQMVDTGKQVLNTSRAILTSMDLSAVLRQGGFIGLGNPIRAARNIAPMLRAFTSDDVAKASLKRIKQRPNWKNYNLAGLYIAETDQTKMPAQEEAFMSRWVDKIPGGAKGLFIGSLVRGSQRAYLTFLNNLRADTFDSMLNQLQKGPTPTREEMESIAKYINVATGRGDLGKGALNQAAVGLNTIFFAPRLVASRFQIIGGMPIFKATGRTKALVLQEYAKFLMGATIVYALAGMAQDDDDEPLEFDPRSSDFLKVRYGDTRVDPLGGLIQATVFTSRIISGETKSAKGKIVPIRDTMRLANLFRDVPRTDKVPYGGRNVFNVGADFMRTKFSPAFGGFVDLTVGENVIGEPVTPLDIAYKMTIPMSFDEARETMEVHGMPKGPALTTLMIFGAGVQTYSDRKK